MKPAAALMLIQAVFAQYTALTPSPGYNVQLKLSGISGARTLAFDASGDLIILARGLNKIVSAFPNTSGVMQTRTIVNASGLGLTHGMALDSGYLYASSDTTVYRWNYTAGQRALTTQPAETVVYNISQGGRGGAPLGHATRTLHFNGGYLYISIGSLNNVDVNTNRSRVRRVQIDANVPAGGYNFGLLEIWADGLRNTVAMDSDKYNRLWGVDNGPDNLDRPDLGVNIHNDNPAEEINMLDGQPIAYGYPYCWTAWNVPGYPRGSQFRWPLDTITPRVTDEWCMNPSNNRAPLAYIEPHASPISASFFQSDKNCGANEKSFPCTHQDDLFVTLHGSWNSNIPKGFKIVRVLIDKSTGTPTGPYEIIAAARDYENVCVSDAALTECFRPAGIAFDSNGTLWVSSDSTGDIVQITIG
jgi:glucose/arabinose dehydrogenase